MNLQPIEERNRAKTLLTPREYQIWNHHHNHGHSQRNIADALNLTRDTIKTNLKRAERKLQCSTQSFTSSGEQQSAASSPASTSEQPSDNQ